MSTIAELRRQEANICQALLKATQEMQSFAKEQVALQDPRTADHDKFDQYMITCTAIQEYLVRHREKLTACLAGQSVPEQAVLTAGPNLSLTSLSIIDPMTAPQSTTTTTVPALSAIQNSRHSLASTTLAPALTGNRLSLVSSGSLPSTENKQGTRLSLNAQPTSKPYLTLSGKPPPKVLSLNSSS